MDTLLVVVVAHRFNGCEDSVSTISDEDKRMLVMHIVEKVFIPDVMIVLHGFVAQMSREILAKKEWMDAVGFAPFHEPIPLDLRVAQQHLADSIVTALKERPAK